ncbi:MAG: response regulator [Opitutaceae bacterium]
MKYPITIIIVEDHLKYRNVLEMAIADEPEMEIVGIFGAAEIALRHLSEVKDSPDIILLDLNLPGMNGLEAISKIEAVHPSTKIIILTQSDAEVDVIRGIREGASGYLLKSSKVGQIKDGIRTVMAGGASLDGKVAQYILNTLQERPKTLELDKPLSDRELEILSLISQGMVKKEIGDKLGISYGSVATYIRRIYEKLNVINAPAAVNKAYRIGLFK